EIHPDRHVLDVIEVIPHLFSLFLEIIRVVITHLCPAGDTGQNRAAQRVIRNCASEELLVGDRMRPRSYQVHVAADHIDKLGQFIESQSAQPSSNARDATEVVLDPFGGRTLDRLHRPELHELEWSTTFAEASLTEQNRAARVEP